MMPTYIVMEKQPHLSQKVVYLMNQESGEKHTVQVLRDEDTG